MKKNWLIYRGMKHFHLIFLLNYGFVECKHLPGPIASQNVTDIFIFLSLGLYNICGQNKNFFFIFVNGMLMLKEFCLCKPPVQPSLYPDLCDSTIKNKVNP